MAVHEVRRILRLTGSNSQLRSNGRPPVSAISIVRSTTLCSPVITQHLPCTRCSQNNLQALYMLALLCWHLGEGMFHSIAPRAFKPIPTMNFFFDTLLPAQVSHKKDCFGQKKNRHSARRIMQQTYRSRLMIRLISMSFHYDTTPRQWCRRQLQRGTSQCASYLPKGTVPALRTISSLRALASFLASVSANCHIAVSSVGDAKQP